MFIQVDEVLPVENVEKQKQKTNLWLSNILWRTENRMKKFSTVLEVEVLVSCQSKIGNIQFVFFFLNDTGV